MELLNAIVTTVNGVVWGWPMIILLLGTHIYMTAKTGFIQRFTITKGIRLSVEKDPDAEGEVSQFGALTTALAATIGTGNIVGVGTAIALGGPGAAGGLIGSGIRMAIPNLIAVLALSGQMAKDTKKYIHNLDAKDNTPVPVVE